MYLKKFLYIIGEYKRCQMETRIDAYNRINCCVQLILATTYVIFHKTTTLHQFYFLKNIDLCILLFRVLFCDCCRFSVKSFFYHNLKYLHWYLRKMTKTTTQIDIRLKLSLIYLFSYLVLRSFLDTIYPVNYFIHETIIIKRQQEKITKIRKYSNN